MTSIIDEDLGIDGVAIARNGRLVFDELVRTELAANDADAGNSDIDLHAVYSITKSFNATVVGIAVDQSLFSTDDEILSLFSQ